MTDPTATTDYSALFAAHVQNFQKKRDSFQGRCPVCKQNSFNGSWVIGNFKCGSCSVGGDFKAFMQLVGKSQEENSERPHIQGSSGPVQAPATDQKVSNAPPFTGLAEAHRSYLEERGLTSDTIAISGFYSASPGDLPRLAGRSVPDATNGLVIRYPNALDFTRIRFFPPIPRADGKFQKFGQPQGTGVRAYIPHQVQAVLHDSSVPLMITEGEVKAIALTQSGWPCIGLGGVYNYRCKDLPRDKMIQDLEQIAWEERIIYLVPDSDAWSNKQVLLAVFSLARLIEDRGAKVEVVRLPVLAGSEKTGADDYLVAKGVEAFRQIIEGAITLRDKAFKPFREREKQTKTPLPEELLGRIIHPALELADGWTSVGVLDERGTWRIITAERQVYEAEAIGDALRSKMRAYPELASRWPDQDLRGFLSGEGSPGFGEILALIIDRIRAVLELPKAELYSFLATWIVGTYFHPIFLTYPRLAFMGERETGKTKAETVISILSFNGLHRIAPTPAVLFRIVQAFRPTLCLDEIEGLNKEDRQEILAIVNSGYKAGGAVDRVEGKATRWIESYQVYSPMVLASIRGLNPTTEDRAIPLVFQRGTQAELLNAEVDPADPRLAQIRGGLYRLLLTKAGQVREMYHDLPLPTWLTARVRELWKPLLTIAALGDQEESLGLKDQLLVLTKAHAEEREPLSEEAMALIAILEETLGMASAVEITPGDLCEKMEQALKVKDVSAQRVGAILRRLGFTKPPGSEGRRGGLSRYRITAEKLREACNRYTPPKIA